MAQPVSVRLNIFCLASARDLVNATLAAVDPTSSGDAVTVPLRATGDPLNVTIAYGASWAMEDVTGQALRAAVKSAGWTPKPSAAEQAVHSTLTSAPLFGTGQRIWLFDGMVLPWLDCAAQLGLDRLIPAPRG